jgi:hypothetical protein
MNFLQSSSFSGFSSLASLLVRHVLEDEATLRYSFTLIQDMKQALVVETGVP